MMSWRHVSVLNAHMPMIRWHTASSAVIVFKMNPMKMRWITISLVSGLSVIENIVTGQPRNPMIWHDTGIYAGVSHDDSTVHQKNKVLPEKDEVDALFLCEKEEFR